MRQIQISFFILLLVVLFQACSVKNSIKKADKRFEIGEYYDAGNLYKNIFPRISFKNKPLRAQIAFRQAECYRLSNQNRAEQSYNNSIRNLYPDSIVYLRYAQTLQQNGKYAEAAKNYSIYLQKDSTNIIAKNGILSAKMVAEWKKTPSRYIVKRSKEFNAARSSSFCPAFLGTSYDFLIFTSSRQTNKKVVQKNNSILGQPNNNLFSSRKNATGKWESPTLVEGDVNTVKDEGVCSLTEDGKIMYFTIAQNAENSKKGTEILSSNRAGGTWSQPQILKIFADSSISVAHPAISADGSTFYFVSDSKKGLGGKDIWRGKLESGECKFIENLGSQINTPGDEMFPTVRADGTLYFSSNGQPGFGGLDIFKATPKKDGTWTVENMGNTINSNADDFGITFAGKSENGYFSSNRNEPKGYDAIWSFELPELVYVLDGKIVDEKGNAIPDANVRLISNTGLNIKAQAKKDGTYRIKLDKDLDCVMMASARGYLNQKNSFTTRGLNGSKAFVIDFNLSSISKPVQMDDIFYEFGKWELTSASETGLQSLVKLLNDNPNITIEISSNTDCIGNSASNKTLSEKRAKSVIDYLISKGIVAERLSAKGNGEDKPVVADAITVQKYSFLKDGDILDELFVQKLTSDQQDKVNQLNRRTEFKVLKTTYKLY
jgi:peptidoglycan-associated lipoprotein